MLLLENNLRKYVKVVLGLFIMVTLLIPWSMSSPPMNPGSKRLAVFGQRGGEVATVLSNGERISSKLHEVTLMRERIGWAAKWKPW